MASELEKLSSRWTADAGGVASRMTSAAASAKRLSNEMADKCEAHVGTLRAATRAHEDLLASGRAEACSAGEAQRAALEAMRQEMSRLKGGDATGENAEEGIEAASNSQPVSTSPSRALQPLQLSTALDAANVEEAAVCASAEKAPVQLPPPPPTATAESGLSGGQENANPLLKGLRSGTEAPRPAAAP